MTKSFFFLIIGLIFSIVSVFHFTRIALEWKIIIDSWIFPSWLSGLLVVLGVFISYWSFKLRKTTKNNSEEKVKEKDA